MRQAFPILARRRRRHRMARVGGLLPQHTPPQTEVDELHFAPARAPSTTWSTRHSVATAANSGVSRPWPTVELGLEVGQMEERVRYIDAERVGHELLGRKEVVGRKRVHTERRISLEPVEEVEREVGPLEVGRGLDGDIPTKRSLVLCLSRERRTWRGEGGSRRRRRQGEGESRHRERRRVLLRQRP